MNQVLHHRYPHNDPLPPNRYPPDDLRHTLSSTQAILDQSPPPSLREILTAYRTKGDGDRDMLLSMLNAKTAEDQRISSLASLQRTVLELYHHTSSAELRSPSPRYSAPREAVNYPSYAQYPPHPSYPPYSSESRPSRRAMTSQHRVSSRSRSPSRPHAHMSLAPRDTAPVHEQHPRKRHRSSRSPPPPHSHRSGYEPSHPAEQFPPSPYSSDRSESAEYSPRSRANMHVGSLLASGGGSRRELNGEAGPQDRE
ncbi:hypothetical protein BKA70DRAFT_1252539 [Coprinopsis sp. MPI-PUGE-AT-0042]|nr:hypothetical protein BKA70DRAFT_1252539 [Coprinopsis sp. MPI-PUGE-AT-0042]